MMLWKILLLFQSVLVQFSLLPFGANALFPSSDWDTTIGEIIAVLESPTVNDSSVLSNLLPLFFTVTDTSSYSSYKPVRPWLFQQVSDRARRLIDTTSTAFTSLLVDALDLLENLRTFRSYEKKIRLMFSPTDISAVRYQGIALDSLLSNCEGLYGKLVRSADINQTFVLAVPLAFIHLSALREKSATSVNSQQYEASRNLTVWLATYWQFVSDGYTRWKEWRISQLQVDRWVHRTLVQNICHTILWDKLFKRHLLNLQIEDCNDPLQLDAHISSVLAQSSNQLEFDMMAIVSKIFILHKFIPGFETVGPFPGNFSTTLQLGPVQPLTYQTLWNKTLPSDSSIFEATCQPSPSSAHFKGITSVTVQQWSWVEDIRVKYENGTDRFQGTPAGGRVESMSFNPNSDQCLASITWRLNISSHMVTSVTFASRNGESVGSVWNTRIYWGDATIYTTAPLFYCIANVAVCKASNSTSAVTSFQITFDLQNTTLEMPAPLIEGLKLIKGNTAFVLVQNGSNIEITQSSAVSRFMDALGVSVPLTVPKKYGKNVANRTVNGKQSPTTASGQTGTPVTRKSTRVPGGDGLSYSSIKPPVATPETLPDENVTTEPDPVLQRGVRSPLVASTYPFIIEDLILIAVTVDTKTDGKSTEKDRIFQDIRQLWNVTLGPNISSFEVFVKTDMTYFPLPVNEDGKSIRQITYQIIGESSVPFDTTATLRKFHEEAAWSNLVGLYAVSDANGALVSTSRHTASSATNQSVDIFDFKYSDEEDQPTTATTLINVPIKTNFIFALRRVKPEEQAEFAVLMAAAWAEANNHMVNEVQVNVTKVIPTVSLYGTLSSNITYTVSGPAPLENPSKIQEYNSSISRAFARRNWPIVECHSPDDYYCYSSYEYYNMFPAYRIFVTALNNTNVDPTQIRNKIRKAVQMANSGLQGTRLEVAFPEYTPPQLSDLVTEEGKRLLEITYFIAATDRGADIETPSPEQVQTQFPGSTVYAEGDPRLRQPVTVVVQGRDDTGPQINFGKLTDMTVIQQEMQAIADQAVKNVAATLNISCLDCTGRLVDVTDLYGLFGRHFLKVVILPENLGPGYPDSIFLAEMSKELVKVINSSSQRLTVASELERNITFSDLNRVYFRDVFYIPSTSIAYYRREMLEPFSSLNKDCDFLTYSSGNCGLEVMVLATESRQSADSSNFTRVYYTVTSRSPYTRYPLPGDVNYSSSLYGSKTSSRLACSTPRCLASTKSFCGWWNETIRDKSNDVSSLSSCTSYQFQCRSSGTCINARYKCDRDRDCYDGSDEENCSSGNSTTVPPVPTSCASTEFRCNDGRCIPLAWTCDGDSDCTDGSDESDFCGAVPCQYIQCTCTSGLCTAIVSKCDSYDDCSVSGSSNSTICTSETTTCKPQEFKCGDGHGCIKQVYRCDGYPDCPDGSDESSCTS